MTLQPAAVVFDDAELVATSYLRGALAARSEPYADSVYVGNTKPVTNRPRAVVVRRDGGPQDGVFDTARLTVRVWANDEQECADLARLVRALLVVSPGTGRVVSASSPQGPQGVPGDSQPQKFFTVELKMRGANL